MALSSFDLTAALTTVRAATHHLNATPQSVELCSEALAAMSKAIAQGQDDILEANTLDLEISRDMAIPELVVDWLKLTPERVQATAQIFQRLSLIGGTQPAAMITHGSGTTYQARPVGVVGFIYEAFPDLGAIAAALCIRTGNALVLKGSSEASRTNQIIASILQGTLGKVGLPAELIFSIESTEVSRTDIAQCAQIDLIIPHGRPSLVEQVVQQTTRPVLPSRMGNCYLYWSASGTLDKVYQMIAGSHTGTPDAVNRIEKVLVHESHSENSIARLWNRLQENGFKIRADESIGQRINLSSVQSEGLAATTDQEWDTAYLKRTVAFRQVSSNDIAIDWINTHSSGHADSIATADYTNSRRFIDRCTAAAVYVNTPPTFVRNARHTSEIALGASEFSGLSGGRIGMAAMQSQQRIVHEH